MVTIIIFTGTKASSAKWKKGNGYENFWRAKNVDHRMKFYPCILIFFLNIENLFSNIANMHIVFLQEYHHYLNIVSTNIKPFFPLKNAMNGGSTPYVY